MHFAVVTAESGAGET